MHSNQADKYKMPFFDTVKTAATVGLLMHQVSVMPCAEAHEVPVSPYNLQQSKETNKSTSNLMMTEAIDFIKDLSMTLNHAYSLLLESNDTDRAEIISTLNAEQTDLVELQLRGLEGAIRNVYNDCLKEKKAILKPSLFATAQARASATKLNQLISQMTNPVDIFHSNINMEGLSALAKHGTEVFLSGRFH